MKKYLAYLICLLLVIAGALYSRSIQYEKYDTHEQIAKGIVLEMKELDSEEPKASWM